MSTSGALHSVVVETLASWITSGRFVAGDTLPVEADICGELGVSRTVLREAVKTLTAKGLLQAGPRVGTRVLPFSHWQLFDPRVIEWRMAAGVDEAFIDDLSEMRLALEPAAAALAARRASEESRRALATAFADMEATAAHPRDYMEADLAFHQAILHATANQFFISLGPLLHSVLHVSFRLSVQELQAIISSLPMHARVLHAIEARDGALATEAMRDIIINARDEIRRHGRTARAPFPQAGT